MNIQNNNPQINFQAKFLHTEDLYDIVKYASEKGKFDEINKARKIIETADPKTRVAVDLCYTGNKPTIIFSHYIPNPRRSGMFKDEFILVKQTDFVSKKANENPLKFGLRQIINLGKQGPNSPQFKEIFKKQEKDEVSIWI